ncbi:MAG: DUF1156 domain-containing protein [Thermoleophilia bacterium]
MEEAFDISFTAALAKREKQIQQNYRPVIGVHKWFARRPGTVFRNLLLSEFNGTVLGNDSYWKAHEITGVIADPFMGGGTPLIEANRLGFNVVGADINPMAYWIVRQSLSKLDIEAFAQAAEETITFVEKKIHEFYTTTCSCCGRESTVKYFIWVKTQHCPKCHEVSTLFPGYMLSDNVRHPQYVLVCHACGELNEYSDKPTIDSPEKCSSCGGDVFVEGSARRNKVSCGHCGELFTYPLTNPEGPPEHKLWAIEYHCEACKPKHKGRFFKKPGKDDLLKYDKAKLLFEDIQKSLHIPDDEIPHGDETKRLHRWGYMRFREMFNERQLLGLGILFKRILVIKEKEIRHALLTVFSDFLRYQNMLCRYDTTALKCQDIFSVHGFPVGLIQCENNLLGIPKIGSGSYRHFIEKYKRAKIYCEHPFETRFKDNRKELLEIEGEKIEATFVNKFPNGELRTAWITASSAEELSLPPNSLDGVFTDPPYYDNVQYAELMDFCYAWLRLGLGKEFKVFQPPTTRALSELTGNETMQKGLPHFTEGLSRIFCHYAAALKQNAPFVFTFHHNDAEAYVPIVIAILDAGLNCTATIPAPAEMGASLHIARTRSSVLDTVFVCRSKSIQTAPVLKSLKEDVHELKRANLTITEGDIRCLLAGHIARQAINELYGNWDKDIELSERMLKATSEISLIRDKLTFLDNLMANVLQPRKSKKKQLAKVTLAATI